MITPITPVHTRMITPASLIPRHDYANYARFLTRTRMYACAHTCAHMRARPHASIFTCNYRSTSNNAALRRNHTRNLQTFPVITIKKGVAWTKSTWRNSANRKIVTAPSAPQRIISRLAWRANASIALNGAGGLSAGRARRAVTATACHDLRPLRRAFLRAGFRPALLHRALHRQPENAGTAARLAGSHRGAAGCGIHRPGTGAVKNSMGAQKTGAGQ